jgi:hypothetical protein
LGRLKLNVCGDSGKETANGEYPPLRARVAAIATPPRLVPFGPPCFAPPAAAGRRHHRVTPSSSLAKCLAAPPLPPNRRRGHARRPSCSGAGTPHGCAHVECRIRSLSKVRVHLQHPRVRALVQTARHSIAPLTLWFQTRTCKKIKLDFSPIFIRFSFNLARL